MKVYVVGNDEKCGGCNWKVDTVYLVARSQKQADEEYREYDRGLCADCLVKMIEDREYEIAAPTAQQRQRRQSKSHRPTR